MSNLSPKEFLNLAGIKDVSDEDIRWMEQSVIDKNTVTDDEKRFSELLLSTEREGAEKLLKALKMNRFFVVPGSVNSHSNWKGGLVAHSLKVYDEAMKIREEMIRDDPDLEKWLPTDSVIICALLHDVSKHAIYEVDSNGKPRHKKDGFPLPCGLGLKSAIEVLQWGIRLLPQETLAICWHMGGQDITNEKDKEAYEEVKDVELIKLIVKADYQATH